MIRSERSLATLLLLLALSAPLAAADLACPQWTVDPEGKTYYAELYSGGCHDFPPDDYTIFVDVANLACPVSPCDPVLCQERFRPGPRSGDRQSDAESVGRHSLRDKDPPRGHPFRGLGSPVPMGFRAKDHAFPPGPFRQLAMPVGPPEGRVIRVTLPDTGRTLKALLFEYKYPSSQEDGKDNVVSKRMSIAYEAVDGVGGPQRQDDDVFNGREVTWIGESLAYRLVTPKADGQADPNRPKQIILLTAKQNENATKDNGPGRAE